MFLFLYYLKLKESRQKLDSLVLCSLLVPESGFASNVCIFAVVPENRHFGFLLLIIGAAHFF